MVSLYRPLGCIFAISSHLFTLIVEVLHKGHTLSVEGSALRSILGSVGVHKGSSSYYHLFTPLGFSYPSTFGRPVSQGFTPAGSSVVYILRFSSAYGARVLSNP